MSVNGPRNSRRATPGRGAKAVPPACRRGDRLCDLHARSRREGGQLEPGRGTSQGLCEQGNPRRALLPLLHRRGQTEWPPRPVHRQAIATGKSEGEGWCVRKDGSRFWAKFVIHAIRDAEGQLVGFAKVIRDLTERRKWRKSPPDPEDGGDRPTHGGIAHDFNNLLTVISGNLETFQRRLGDYVDDRGQ